MSETKMLQRESLEPKIAVVLGTRPGIIKLSPVIRRLRQRNVPFLVIHTGQHYSPELDTVFFRDLELPPPDVQLPSMSGWTRHGEQTAEMLKGVEGALIDSRPMGVLVGGDANTNLSAALAARKLNIQVCHDEAGLRSYDWLMPEEHNRVMMDHISEFLFCPNEDARRTLEAEQVRGRIHVTGTTIVDAVSENRAIAERTSTILSRLQLESKHYVLMTVHHEETVDYIDTLRSVLEGALAVASSTGRPVIFPAHPRTRKRLDQFGLRDLVQSSDNLRVIEPLGYLDFLTVHAHAALMMTDSGGGIQEAAVLGVPCLTLGRVTEWQETVAAGANLVCGTDSASIVSAAEVILGHTRTWENPFGTPGASRRIVDVIENEVLSGNGFLPKRPEIDDRWRPDSPKTDPISQTINPTDDTPPENTPSFERSSAVRLTLES